MAPDSSSDDRLNVFISYSRDDLAFSDQLEQALKTTGFDTTLDRHGITGGEDWKTRLGSLILAADTIVFVLSPSSAASDICKWEVEEAVRAGKRILPVLCRPLGDAVPPKQLADLNYIFFYPEPKSPGSGFGNGLQRLVEALNTDLDWLREHTRLLERAAQWEAGERPANRLLSGPDVDDAKTWIAKRPKAAPAPLPLQLDFIKASEQEENRLQNEEAVRLRQMAEAQAARGAALEAEAAAQSREADALKREAVQSRKVLRRTVGGLVVAVGLAIASVYFAAQAKQSETVAIAARFQADTALKEQLRIVSDAFETGWSALGSARRDAPTACDSIMTGVRLKFCSVEQVMSLQTLSNLSGIPLFIQGPHSVDQVAGTSLGADETPLQIYGYNLRSHEIGHYNPAFLEWLIEFAVPATQDPAFRTMSQSLYEANLAPLIETYQWAYDLVNDPSVATLSEEILADYKANLSAFTAADEVRRHADSAFWASSPHSKLMIANRQIVDRLTDLSPELTYAASFELRVAMGFWFRRKVDGTEDQFYELMKLIEETYL